PGSLGNDKKRENYQGGSARTGERRFCCLEGLALEPRPFADAFLLEGRYFTLVLHREANSIKALQQAVATERIQLEAELLVAGFYNLLLKVDGDLAASLGIFHQLINLVLRQLQGQH